MFIGHFAVGLAGKKLAPKASLAALWLAAVFADVLWPVLVAVGAEDVRIVPGTTAYTPLDFVRYPWSHSLLMLLIWGGLFAAYYRKRPDGARTGAVLGALVVSHWVLDWITHRPDMPLWPGGPKYGLGLWESVIGTMVVEISMFIVGLFLYLQCTRSRDRTGGLALLGLIALLVATYIADSLSAAPPPSVEAMWISALIATAVVLAWAQWVERHRVSTGD
ncbi:MAG TPA: metal-dependent hydrolase [Gemmatimonadaceae bacterium]|nr:metal-dependent hydrolase [Gemmatimonadaceae bacterium]